MSKVRVAIVTLLYRNYNYGGVLQSYALQKYICDLGYSCDVIKLDRLAPRSAKEYIWNRIKHLIRCILGRNDSYYSLLISNSLKSKRRSFDAFVSEYISQSEKVYNSKNIRECLNNYDVFICGSDQVWSPVSGRDETFLSFVPDDRMKIAYAASIGADVVSDDYLEYIKPLVSRLNAISVREFGALDILDSFLDKNRCALMPDPTLLLSVEQWSSIVVPVSELAGKAFTLLYFIGEDNGSWLEAHELAKSYNNRIVNIPYNKMSFNARDYKHRGISMDGVGPREFLWLVMNAQVILTDSFHGAVFSILFNKRYRLFTRLGENANGVMRGRISTLLDIFQLPLDTTTYSVDYEQVLIRLEDQRKMAKRFITDSIADGII